MRLALIGLAAGVFSALFGVGGGIVIVPLLLASGAYDERSAAGTSLAAIGLISLVGAISYAIDGHVKLGPAAIVGLPAALGAIGGAELQQHLSGRTLRLAFSLLLAGVGVRLIVG
jgi:uncharacterized protein